MAEEEEVIESEEINEEVAEETNEPDSLPDVPEVAAEEGGEEQAESASPWENFRTLPEFEGQDDNQIAARLYEAMQREQAATSQLQQYQAVIPAASEYLSNRESYQQWLQSQQAQQQQAAAPQAPQQQQPAKWWNPPQLQETDKQYLTMNEAGQLSISDRAPLDARARLIEHQNYKANFAQKFLEDPAAALGPMVEQMVTERAQNITNEKISGMQEQAFVQQIEAQNKDWLYDQEGNASPAGLLVQKYIEDARQMGLQGVESRWDYAYKMVERDLLVQRYISQQQAEAQPPQQEVAEEQPQQPAESPAERNMNYLRQQATRKATVRSGSGSNARTPSRPMSFADRLAANLQQSGLAE